MDKETTEMIRKQIEAEQAAMRTEEQNLGERAPQAQEVMEPDLEAEQEYRLKHGFDRFGRTTIALGAVKVKDRTRIEMGDIEDFAEGIRARGLMHAIVIDDDDNLIAGGRRYAAFTYLLTNNKVGERGEKYDEIPFVRFGALPPAERKILEIEENIKRKEMTWQERIIGIAEYHTLNDSRVTDWSQTQTGKMLGVSQGYVSTAVNLASMLKDKDSPLWKLGSVPEAIKFVAAKNYDAAAVEQARRLQAKRMSASAESGLRNVILPQTSTVISPGSPTPISAGGPITPSVSSPAQPKPRISKEEVASMFVHGNAIDKLLEIRKITTINHIICDPPYAIDTGNLKQDDKYRIEATHQVDANKKLIHQLLLLGYDVIQPDGFMCMWYDQDMHQQIIDWAEQIGWRVQHWSVVWCKTSNCQNQSAHFNVTKATEHCMMLRRSEQSTIKLKQAKNYIIGDAVSSPTHPFIKPDFVWRYLIETVSTENQVIVDPVCGEGSSLLTGFRMNRQCLGIELEDYHVAHGIQWIYDELNQIVPNMILDEAAMDKLI